MQSTQRGTSVRTLFMATMAAIIVASIYLWRRVPSTYTYLNYVEIRRCGVPWRAMGSQTNQSICLTTLSDSKLDTVYTRAAPRNFSQVIDLTWENKLRYVQKHNYSLFNASDLVDTSRPPSWSKILAVKDAFSRGCDWVFWTDADSLIMNSAIELEDILPADPSKHFVIAIDINGYNAGMWMLRNCDWSTQFLDLWWSKSEFILQPGLHISGDNHALKMILANEVDKEHVLDAPQCSFNSYYPSEYEPNNLEIRKQANFLELEHKWKEGNYVKGDFAIHFAGIVDKEKSIMMFLEQAT